MKREKHTEPTNLRVDERLLKSPQNFFLPTFVFLIGDIGKEVKTLIFEEDKIKKTKAVFKGWIDGLKFKMN